jgi:stress response protein SCP2
MTGMLMAELYKHNDDWKLAAIGNGVSVNGLVEIVKSYS